MHVKLNKILFEGSRSAIMVGYNNPITLPQCYPWCSFNYAFHLLFCGQGNRFADDPIGRPHALKYKITLKW